MGGTWLVWETVSVGRLIIRVESAATWRGRTWSSSIRGGSTWFHVAYFTSPPQSFGFHTSMGSLFLENRMTLTGFVVTGIFCVLRGSSVDVVLCVEATAHGGILTWFHVASDSKCRDGLNLTNNMR